MTLLSILLLSTLLVVLAVLFWVVTQRQREHLRHLQAVESAIVAEERRLFSFLHDLGESLSDDNKQKSMHRLIVEGALRVTDSGGGAIYLLDESHKSLVPKFYSDDCSPLVALPERIVAMAKKNPSSLLSFLRLHAVGKNVGVIGAVFTSQQPQLILNLKRDERFGTTNNPLHQATAAMLCPLSCGNRQLGVLAVTAPKDRSLFNENDFEVFRSLAEQSAFALANSLVREEVKAKQQIDAELRAASAIQRILLPETDPKVAGYGIAGQNIPARVLSGDFYDYIELGEGQLGVVIADVSGKGTAAALISAMCRSIIRCVAPGRSSPTEVLAEVNRQLYPDMREDMFVTITYLVLDPQTHTLRLARAGHTPPLVWRQAEGTVETLTARGMAVGIDKGEVFERVTHDIAVTLHSGDCLLLYTDGITEASDRKELMFGEERVERALATRVKEGPRAVLRGLISELDVFAGGQRSLDDITLIALQKMA
jgi:sigma-B regulation protein RsbU (phosphoserine phosphatase)